MAKNPLRSKRRDTAGIVQGLRRIVKALHTYSREVDRQFGLTGPQLWALKTLLREGPLSTGQLAEALAVHQSSISLLLVRLEKRGMVRRVRDGRDRRVTRVELSPKGANLAGRAPEAAQGRLLHGLDAMSNAEVQKLRRAVDRLVQAMEATDVTAPFFFVDD